MAVVTVVEAARLVSKSTVTIYRHIKSGKLSRLEDGIETSELIRAYGSIINNTETTKEATALQPDTSKDSYIESMKQQIIDLKREMEAIKTDSKGRELWLRALLENKSEPNNDLREQVKEAKEREQRLMALLENNADNKPVGIFGSLFK